MRLFYVIHIKEFETRFCGLRFSNRALCAMFAVAEIFFVALSFLQHVYSWWKFSHVFYCRSAISNDATVEQRFLAYDIVIFDFGLVSTPSDSPAILRSKEMHRVLGTNECVANYLDGGYMRCSWCLQHASSLMILLLALGCMPTPIWLLWPALLLQSSYVLGMSILTMATLPKLLEALGGLSDQQLNTAFCIYTIAFCLNWMFTFVLWHYYWGIEAKYSTTTDTAKWTTKNMKTLENLHAPVDDV